MSARRVTRRAALAQMGAAGAFLLTGCGGSSGPSMAADGSTRRAAFVDAVGDGQLELGPGASLLARTELGPRARAAGVLATLAHLTDAHVVDAESPARVTFLDRLGAPFASTFRPHETLTSHILAGAVRAIDAFGPDVVLQGGDLIDNAQDNELARALAILSGGRVRPGSGGRHYDGVQSAAGTDPFYYRPAVDAPRHPGMIAAARRPFSAPGLRAPWLPVLGDHDLLVQGVLPPTPTTRAIALGTRAIRELPPDLHAPTGFTVASGSSPDGVADPAIVDRLIAQTLAAPGVTVARDAERRELEAAEVLSRLRGSSGHGGSGAWLDHTFDVGERVRLIVLDLVRRDGGSGGRVHDGQPAWLAEQLRAAGDRWVVVVSHQPLTTSEGGAALLALLDGSPRVLAALWGHTHRHRIVARRTRAGGYWLISTGSLIDHPQQARALRIVATAGGGVALQTWLLDHVPAGGLGGIARSLAYLDAQGGRPQGFAGRPADRNVVLYRRAAG